MPHSRASAGSGADDTITIQVAETLNKRQALTEALRTQAVALPQVLVLVVAILLIVYGYTFVLRPMQRLRALIDNRGSNDLSPLDPEAAPQDLRPLILSINGLMERLSTSVAAQRRFIADAAHQLRTPLAGIKSQTELALVERDPGAVRVALKRLAKGTEHATELANRLLTLARAGTPLTAPPVDVDLIGVVRDTIAQHLPDALARRHDLGFEGRLATPCVVHGDALLLREMLSNLIDNALRYSPDGGAITVSVERDPRSGGVTLATSVLPGPNQPSVTSVEVYALLVPPADSRRRSNSLGPYFFEPLNIMCSKKCEIPVMPGRSLREPTRYHCQKVMVGTLWSSWVSTTTFSSGSTARTTPRTRHVRSTPAPVCWRRAVSSSAARRALSRPHAR
jgi:two-component system sensor histidine kinase TctE